jgi:hypothetical protein
MFAPDCGPAGTVFVDHDRPWYPVVDGNTLYLTNLDVDSGQKPDTIEVYDVDGTGKPSRKLSHPPIAAGIGLAIDKHHNLFWSATDYGGLEGEVVEFPRGKMPGSVLSATKIGKDSPGGVLIDSSDNLLFIDVTSSAILLYAPPYNSPAFAVIPLKVGATYCALSVNQKQLFCMDDAGLVDAYKYPSGDYSYSYSNGIEGKNDPFGIATGRGSATKGL